MSLKSMLLTLCLLAPLAACANDKVSSSPSPESADPAHTNGSESNSFISPTIYYKPKVDLTAACKNEEPRIDVWVQNNNEIPAEVQGKLCKRDFENCLLQGSCALIREDKTTISINYVKTDPEKRRIFSRVNLSLCPYGYGVRNSCLDPFYTIAADPTLYPFGTVIYIEKVKGTQLPDGSTHSGYFIVRDRGGGISGKGRFDFFTGYLSHRDWTNPFVKLKMDDVNTRYEFKVIDGELAAQAKASRVFPRIPKTIEEK